MPVEVQGRIGGQSAAASGSIADLFLDGYQGVGASFMHGKRFLPAYYGRLFHTANQAAQALSLLSTTFTGVSIWNPPGSGVLASIEEVAFALSSVDTGQSAVLLFAFTGTPSAFTTQLGTFPARPLAGTLYPTTGTSGKVQAYSALTLLVAPGGTASPILRPLSTVFFGTSVGVGQSLVKDEVGGAIVIPPGVGAGLCAITTAVTGIGSITWEEIPSPPF